MKFRYNLIDAELLAKRLKTLVDRHTTMSVVLAGESKAGSPDAMQEATTASIVHAAKAEAYERVIDMVLRDDDS